MRKRPLVRHLVRGPRVAILVALVVLTLLLGGCAVVVGRPEAAVAPAEIRGPQNQSVMLVTVTPGRQVVPVGATAVVPGDVPGLPGVPETGPAQQPPGAVQATPDVPATVQAAIAATLAAQGAITAGTSPVFLETFDDNRNGWFETHDAQVREVWIEGGEYHYVVKEPWEGISHIGKPWEVPDEPLARIYGDVSIQVRVRVERDTNGYGGLALCIDDIYTSYYAFYLLRDGSWFMEKRLGTEWFVLADGDPSPGFKPGGASNLLRLDRSGSELVFYVNGVQIGSVTDTSFSAGYVGVMAGKVLTSEEGAHRVFDDFQLQALE